MLTKIKTQPITVEVGCDVIGLIWGEICEMLIHTQTINSIHLPQHCGFGFVMRTFLRLMGYKWI
jgi:hypothetical protein